MGWGGVGGCAVLWDGGVQSELVGPAYAVFAEDYLVAPDFGYVDVILRHGFGVRAEDYFDGFGVEIFADIEGEMATDAGFLDGIFEDG